MIKIKTEKEDITMNALEKIVAGKKMPILFIGSGISKRYLYNYPNWEELLRMSFAKIDPDEYLYQKHFDALKRKGISDFDLNIELGSIVEDEFNSAFFDRKIKVGSGNKPPRWVKAGISPYKMFLSLYFKKLRLNTKPALQEEIVKFKSLKNKISAVITTNYDLFLEKEIFSSDFKVFVHQNELFSYDSYNIAEIYKIHGSVTDAESIIITKQDYEQFNASRKLIIAKMLTLFAESPIIFMGYSFTDEDVQAIISDFLGCLSKNDLEHINEHFIFISYKKGETDLKELRRTILTANGTEIPITDIETDNFSLVYDILGKITPGISPTRIRETKRVVKTIVDQSATSDAAESLIVGIDNLDDIDLSSKPLAIAIGYKENILNKVGYGLLDDELILEDILYDNRHFDNQLMCTDRFKSLPHTRLTPVFKYATGYSGTLDKNSKLYKYIEKHDTIEKIIPKNVLKTLNSIPVINDTSSLQEEINNIDNANKKAGVLLKNIQNFEISEIRELCKIIFEYDRSQARTSTNFKRCVMYIDYMENYKKKS